MAIKLIYWDIDGTLLYCGSAGSYALKNAFLRLYGIEDALTEVRVGSAMDAELVRKVFDKYDISETEGPRFEITYLVELGKELESMENKHVHPGVKELLAHKDFIHSLLTSNFRAGAYMKLGSVGLLQDDSGAPFFIGGGFGDHSGEKWDAADRARTELKKASGKEVRPEEVLIIGDSVYDINTARKCGYYVMSVGTGYTDAATLKAAMPDLWFDDLGDTDSVLQAIHTISN